MFHHKLRDDAFDGSTALYLILLLGIAFYAVSYFARGWLAGHQHFKLYGGLLFMESTSRCAFALAVAIGIAHGQGAVATGIAVAPLVSLVVLPIALQLRNNSDFGWRSALSAAVSALFSLAALAAEVAEIGFSAASLAMPQYAVMRGSFRG